MERRLRKIPTDRPDPRLAGLVLAAGEGGRYGDAKQLLLWDGEPLVARSARLASLYCGAGVSVVTGAHAESVRQALEPLAVKIVHNAHWAEGMSGSLRLGLSSLPAAAEATLVLLIDQPLIPESHLQALVERWQAAPSGPVATDYGDRGGVPAVLPRGAFRPLMSATGDRGATAWLNAQDGCPRIPCLAAEHDIDTPEDWARAVNSRLQ